MNEHRTQLTSTNINIHQLTKSRWKLQVCFLFAGFAHQAQVTQSGSQFASEIWSSGSETRDTRAIKAAIPASQLSLDVQMVGEKCKLQHGWCVCVCHQKQWKTGRVFDIMICCCNCCCNFGSASAICRGETGGGCVCDETTLYSLLLPCTRVQGKSYIDSTPCLRIVCPVPYCFKIDKVIDWI